MGFGAERNDGCSGSATICVVKVDCGWRGPFRYTAKGQIYSTRLLLMGCAEKISYDLATDDVNATDDHCGLDLLLVMGGCIQGSMGTAGEIQMQHLHKPGLYRHKVKLKTMHK